jgi:hypothetical protein
LIAPAGGSEIAMGSDALRLEGSGLSFGGDDDLSLGEGSDAPLAGGSAIDLVGDMDDDLVLGGSSHGDLSRTGDSGISLLNPADSGLSLETQPLALGGSAVESLELGEDDMLVADEPPKKPAAKKQAAAAPESDDDFLLAPLEDTGEEESDSGSQVIALDDDVEFDEPTPGASAITGEVPTMGGLLEEDLDSGLSGGGSLGALTPAAAHSMAAAPAGAGAVVPDAVFTGWNVTSLALCAVMLIFCGMFAFDLLRNMWSWNGTYGVNSWMMDSVLSLF